MIESARVRQDQQQWLWTAGVCGAILADATNLGLGRMVAASHGITRDKLIWTADAYIRPETYKAALARIISPHNALPIASTWATAPPRPLTGSSSDRPSAEMPPVK